MFMTRHKLFSGTRPLVAPLLLAGCAVLCLGVGFSFAQGVKDQFEWPKTFSGQPDFDFSRQEIVEEFLKKNKEGTAASNSLATLDKLLNETITDPFNPKGAVSNLFTPGGAGTGPQAQIAGDGTQAVARPINPEALEALFGPGSNGADEVNLPQFDLIVPQLPGFSNQKNHFDLSEFRRFLDNVISQESRYSRADLRNRDFGKDLERVVIQSIVTSPRKYAIINQNRYSVGDRFLLPVTMDTSADNIESVIDAYLPHPDTVGADVYQQYLKLKQEALAKYQSKNSDPEANAATHNISVTIRDILRREVKVSIYGREYGIRLRLAL